MLVNGRMMFSMGRPPIRTIRVRKLRDSGKMEKF